MVADTSASRPLYSDLSNYNAASIEVLHGLDPVRKRPGMYTDVSTPNHLLQEVLDNSVDEALAGTCRFIRVQLCADGWIEVEDDGRGMPIDIHPEQGRPGVEVIMLTLHAGAKFSRRTYSYSGGLHGVGVSVVNALSERLEVRIRRGGEHHCAFEQGELVEPLSQSAAKPPRGTQGTLIRFKPEASYFHSTSVDVSRIAHLMRAKAVLCPGLELRFIDERTGREERWRYEKGLAGYLDEHIEQANRLPQQLFCGEFSSSAEDGNQQVEWALCWTPGERERLCESYANLLPTPDGGTHMNGLRTGVSEAVREFCSLRNLVSKGVKLTPEDVFRNLNYVLSLKLENPEFIGQTKERLTTRNSQSFVAAAVKDTFSLWLNAHTATAEEICSHIVQNAQERMRAAQASKRKRTLGGPTLPGKLVDCSSTNIEETEIFIVEGDSAGGSAKQARDRHFQAVLPLRGKILNSWEVDSGRALASQEIRDLSASIGIEPGTGDIEGLRYGKICILADADADGAHISSLLCALFIRHFPQLVRGGHICVALPPLFRVDCGKEVFYARDNNEKDKIIGELEARPRRAQIQITRFKGLGEMDPPQLRETVMKPGRRQLARLHVDDDEAATNLLDMLLNKKRAADRRAWLSERGVDADIAL